ncbi:MAG: hypothetical protein KC416_03475, partial [Myxococcales bacterium]|nr:hypothetical protein [Myxococcales bacterium]
MAADLPPDPIVDLAGACVRFVERALGLTLDFTQDTLPVLDHYLAQLHEEKRRELQEVVAPAAGAYFGEVLRRTLGDGTWYTPDNEYNRWRLEFGRCFLHLNPIGVSVESIIQGDAAGWNAHIQVLDA